MLDKSGTRQLAYVVIVDDVTSIEGYDRVELAHVGGWTIVVGKNSFQPGDPAIYVEIDSKLPEKEPFTNMEFLAKKKFKIKTQKMCGVYSQGLLLSATDLGWNICGIGSGGNSTVVNGIIEQDGTIHRPDDESRFLTDKIGVTYYVPEDNKRKAKSADKYQKMIQRKRKLFSHYPFKWLIKKTWGRKFLFIFFGRKKDRSNWPQWVKKTDEERIQNLPYLFNDKSTWIATEKIDGTSTTFTLKRKKGFHKEEFYVCSRNVVFDKPDKKCYYDTNVYLEMAEKYKIYEKMKKMLNTYFSDCDWITIQGETYGKDIQKRNYHLKEHNFMAFNFITSKSGRWNSIHMKELLEKEYGIPCVPILNEHYVLPDTIEELEKYTCSETSAIDGDLKEGIVFRSQDGSRSFKYVSPEFLIKYH